MNEFLQSPAAQRALELLPASVVAITLVLFGYVFARIAKFLLIRLLGYSERLTSILPRKFVAAHRLLSVSQRVLPVFGFWIVIVIFVTAALDVLNLAFITQLLDEFIGYLPRIFAALFILAVGFISAELARSVIEGARLGVTGLNTRIVGQLTGGLIIVIAVLIGAQQLGLDISLLTVLMGIVFAAIALGLTLLAVVGARVHIENEIATQRLRRLYSPGNRLTVAGHHGRVTEIREGSLFLETENGVVVIPGRLFSTEIVVRDSDDD